MNAIIRWWKGEDVRVKVVDLRSSEYGLSTIVETDSGHRMWVSGHRVRSDEIGIFITVNSWDLMPFSGW